MMNIFIRLDRARKSAFAHRHAAKQAFLAGLIGLIWLASAGSKSAAQIEQRNVLIIIADDMGVDTMSRYGVGSAPTHMPNLDALAEEGLLFENAWAYPICTPFRAAALTGRFGFRTGVGTVGGGSAATLPQSETIIPEILSSNPELGASHAAIGKWHLGGGRTGPTDHGFAHNAGVVGTISDYYSWRRSVNGQISQETRYVTSVQVDDASAWIRDQGENPWFMWLAFNAPHDPFHRPPDDLHTVDLPPGDPPERGGNVLPYYQAALEALDTEMGRLLSEMDPEVRADTTIIFVGDNGSPSRAIGAPFTRDTSKGSLYQGGVWTPLIISGAGIEQPGRRVSHLVHSVDLLATSLDLLGLPVEDWPQDIDSQSLRPFMEQVGHPALRDWAFSERFGTETENGAASDGKTIRDLRYKYIRFDDGREAFYDLEADPYEQRELIASGLEPEEDIALEDLRARLDALLSNQPATATPDATVIAPTPTADLPNPTPTAAMTATPGSSPAATSTTAPEDHPNRLYLPLALRNAGPLPIVEPEDTPTPAVELTPNPPTPTEAATPTDEPGATATSEPTPDPDACPQASFLDVQPHPENSEFPDPVLEVSCDEDLIHVETNGIPSFEYREVTRFPLREQELSWEIPRNVTTLDEPEDLPLLGPVAIMVDGLPIYGPNEADQLGFGDPYLDELLDFCNGHTGLQGGYHFHAIAKCLWEEDEFQDNTDLVVGYAFDGNPIMAPFVCANEDCSEIKELQSSWQHMREVRAAWEAHEYVEGSGDLDKCNGLRGEDGQYRYYATKTFPYFLGCFVGEPRPNTVRGGGGGGRPPRQP